jgi:prophage regulatory protein
MSIQESASNFGSASMPPIPAEQISPYPCKAPPPEVQSKPPGAKARTPHQPRAPPQEPPDRVLRWREVRDRIGLSRATIWRMVRNGVFPAPVRLGPQSVGWIEREVIEWIADRAARRPFKQNATT